MSRRPDLFIIGAPKSGTTSLHAYLSGHPDVFMAPIKEPMYFSPDVNGEHTAYQHPVDEERYLALFSGAGDEKWIGEASPRYLRSAVAPGLVREFQPDARIVAIFRNPVEVVQALHDQRHTTGHEEIADFSAALAADRDRPLSFYFGAVRYGDDLARWLESFGPDRIHTIVFDEFVSDTPGEFARLLRFLDVDDAWRPESFAVHNKRFRRGPLFGLVRESAPARFVARRLLPALLPDHLRRKLVRSVRHTTLIRRPAQKKAIPADVRRSLEAEFQPQVERLGEILDRDLVDLWFSRQ